MQWEIKQIKKHSVEDLIQGIADEGLLGWEPCCVLVSSRYAILKRPRPTPEATTEVTEYITPTAEHVGQMVEVRDRDDQRWAKEYKLVMILPEERKYRFVVDNENNNGGLPAWKQARIAVK